MQIATPVLTMAVMSAPLAIEERLLADVAALIDAALAGDRDDHDARLDLLEAVAAQLGGFSLGEYRCRDGLQRRLTERDAMRVAPQIVDALSAISMHPSLALTSLARAPLTLTQRRRAGAYYTDFRLARFLSARLSRRCAAGESVIDPASGTGILLVAAALSSCDTQAQIDRFIAQSAHAADLSAPALRAVKLALASLTSDLDAIDALSRRLRTLDSLIAGPDGWSDVAPDGFDFVIANPPWEKLKLTRHEHLAAAGLDRHYGAEYDGTDLTELRARARADEFLHQPGLSASRAQRWRRDGPLQAVPIARRPADKARRAAGDARARRTHPCAGCAGAEGAPARARRPICGLPSCPTTRASSRSTRASSFSPCTPYWTPHPSSARRCGSTMRAGRAATSSSPEARASGARSCGAAARTCRYRRYARRLNGGSIGACAPTEFASALLGASGSRR